MENKMTGQEIGEFIESWKPLENIIETLINQNANPSEKIFMNNFKSKLEWLCKEKIIGETLFNDLSLLNEYRNKIVHDTSQSFTSDEIKSHYELLKTISREIITKTQNISPTVEKFYLVRWQEYLESSIINNDFVGFNLAIEKGAVTIRAFLVIKNQYVNLEIIELFY